MMKTFLTGIVAFIFSSTYAQVVTTSPVFPRADEPVTITIDVTGTSIDQFAWNNTTNPVWIWSWISDGCSSSCDALTNVNPATSPGQDGAKMTRISTDPDVYQITFTPTVFFGKPIANINQIGLKLKSRDWNENKQTDNNKYITFNNANDFLVAFTQPSSFPVFKNQNDQLSITGASSEVSGLTLKINGNVVATDAANTTLSYVHTITENPGLTTVTFEANNGAETKIDSFTYVVRSATVNEARPTGIIDGINYSNDHTKVTLSLWAPGKESVYVLGDFSDWIVSPVYQMKKSGEHFWIEISNLEAGVEYAYKYLINETVYVADPYADKILDPDDQYIPASIYPDLKPYPEGALSNKSYFNRASVFQTNQTPYQWQTEGYVPPAQEKLVIYEMLVRDFFAEDERNYQNLIDTINYFKRLGINAIELMPITEFNGNNSWGYNPTFMFAPDKAYGTKNKLKEFVDVCHQNGIAVIMDMVMNQQDSPNPYALMDFNFTEGVFSPTANNKWFNVSGKHPYGVFFDLNHESAYTKKYLDTVNYYWLNEYKIDGFRFDLSKGFTQNERCAGSTSNEFCFQQKDDSRIAILKRMADKIWSHTPEAYVILEHFAENSEEVELANYGMMLWSRHNDQYGQSAMGYASNSDFSGIYYGNRSGWLYPHAVGYMESHDEERMMYKNLQSGNISGSYSVKNLNTALTRMKAIYLMFLTVPGPKMIWEFGELGYDQPINLCENGTVSNDCRLSPKPVLWEYQDVAARADLFNHVAGLLKLRNTFDVFTEGAATLLGGSTLQKQLTLKSNPYTATPSNTSQMNIQIVANLDVVPKIISTAFPHTGKWYEYYSGTESTISGTPYSVSLQPGQFKLYSDVKITFEDPITSVESEMHSKISLFPNPVGNQLSVSFEEGVVDRINVKTIDGRSLVVNKLSNSMWDTSALPKGIFIVEVFVYEKPYRFKIIKR